MSRNELVWLGSILLYVVVGVLAYPYMPETMATHWNAAGQVDGYSPRSLGVFLFPVLYGAIALLFIAIPRIDPLKANIELFRRYYDGLVYVFAAFFLGVYLQVIAWNAGISVSPTVFFPVGIGVLFYYLGVLLAHARRNWFVGIRDTVDFE